MNLVRLQYGGGGGELHGASITVNTEETTLVGKEALLYKVSDLSTIINRTVFSALSSDGVSTATFNNIIEPDTYIVKTSDGTDEGNTGNIEITSDDIINKTTLVRSLSLTIELNFTVYSASNDTVYYYPNNDTSQSNIILCTTDSSGKGNATLSIRPNTLITFFSTVAKDTANLTNNYSKSITLTADTTEIHVMPEGSLYWYGNRCEKLPLGGAENLNTSNGWIDNSVSVFIPPIENTNYLDCATSSSGTSWSGIGNKDIVDLSKYSKFNGIIKGIEAYNGSYGMFGAYTSKDLNSVVDYVTPTTNITKLSIDLPSSTKYVASGAANHRREYIYAMWLE